jgi:hypothetical protein
MTLRQMMVEVYENLGKDSTLTPYSDWPAETTFELGLATAARLRNYVNRAYEKIATWKRKRGKVFDFPALHKKTFFQTSVVTGTSQGGGGDDTFVLEAGSSSVDDTYNGYTVYVSDGTGSGQIRIIVDYDGATVTATINRDWDTNPDDTSTYVIYKNFYTLSELGIDSPDRFYHHVRLFDMGDKKQLSYGSATTSYLSSLENYGDTPSSYITQNSTVFFNVPVYEARWYEFEYVELPEELSGEDDEPVIPTPFHEAIVFYATWLHLKKKGENNDAWSFKQDIEDLMENTRCPGEGQFDNIEVGYGIIAGTNYTASRR